MLLTCLTIMIMATLIGRGAVAYFRRTSSLLPSRLYGDTSTKSGRSSAGQIKSDSSSKRQMPKDIIKNPPKGTRDFFPEDMRLRNWLFGKWKAVAWSHGFEEYDAPVVESEELYIRKAGEEITDQLYNFQDKAGRSLSLRPEMTPSLARMVLSRGNSISYPLKWFSIPQCWRYERMTRGRRREHYQWNMDVWGVEGIEAEAELLSALVTTFRELGLTSEDVVIKINSRKVLNSLMVSLGIAKELWSATCVLIDKLEKVPLSALTAELESIGLEQLKVEQLLAMLQKSSDLNELSQLVGSGKEGLEPDGIQELQYLMKLLQSYGISEWVKFDASTIRGLSYYTGVVFEAVDRKGELRAICGGGRYDELLASMGGSSVPAVGFGFGDAVIVELLRLKGLLPSDSDLRETAADVLVYAMSNDLRSKAPEVASLIRAAGFRVDLVLDNKKVKWAFQRAEKIGAAAVVMLADEEYGSNEQLLVKNLATRMQEPISQQDIVSVIRSIVQSDE